MGASKEPVMDGEGREDSARLPASWPRAGVYPVP